VLLSLPKADGSSMVAGPNVGSGCKAKSKTIPKSGNSIGLCYSTGPNSSQPNPKHFKKDSPILGLARQLDPISLGLVAQPYPKILLFVL